MLKKIISLVGATGFSGALTLLASIAPSWFLSAEDYGYFSQFYVAISIFSLVLGLGLTVSFTYYIGQGRIDSKRISLILKRLDILCLWAAMLALFAILFFDNSGMMQATWYGLIVAAFLVRGTNLPSIYLGRQKIFQYNLSLLLRPGIMVFAVGCWAIVSSTLQSLFICVVIFGLLGYIISLVLSQYELPGKHVEPNGVGGKQFLSYGLVGLLSNLSYMLGQRGFVYLLGASISAAQAGVFFMFLALLEVLLLVPSAIGLYFFSRAARGALKKRDVMTCVSLAIGVFIVANIFFYTAGFIGERYSILPALYVDLCHLMLFSIPLQVCMLFLKIFSQVACGYGLVRLTMYGSMLGGLTSIVAGYFFIGAYQVNGAIVALFIGNLLNIALVGIGLHSSIKYRGLVKG